MERMDSTKQPYLTQPSTVLDPIRSSVAGRFSFSVDKNSSLFIKKKPSLPAVGWLTPLSVITKPAPVGPLRALGTQPPPVASKQTENPAILCLCAKC